MRHIIFRMPNNRRGLAASELQTKAIDYGFSREVYSSVNVAYESAKKAGK